MDKPGQSASLYATNIVQMGNDDNPWIVVKKNNKKKWVPVEKMYFVKIQIDYDDCDTIREFLEKNKDFKETFDGTGMNLKTRIYDLFYYPKDAQQMKRMQTRLIQLEKKYPIVSYASELIHAPIKTYSTKKSRKKFFNLF